MTVTPARPKRPSDEAFLGALADGLHQEYQAIVDAGFFLQINDRGLPDGAALKRRISGPERRSGGSEGELATTSALPAPAVDPDAWPEPGASHERSVLFR